jgi:hypothetical protein
VQLKFLRKKLSPPPPPLVSCRHPRPHEGASGSGSESAGGERRPRLGVHLTLSLGRLSQTAASRDPRAAKTCAGGGGKPPSDPPLRQYDRSASPRAEAGLSWRKSQPGSRRLRDAKDRKRRTRTPGDRLFIVRNGRSAPVSSRSFACAGTQQQWRAPGGGSDSLGPATRWLRRVRARC